MLNGRKQGKWKYYRAKKVGYSPRREKIEQTKYFNQEQPVICWIETVNGLSKKSLHNSVS
jgi:hypothetical protein